MMPSDVCLSDVCLSLSAYIGPKSKTEKPRKTKIGTEVARVTLDADTIFKVKRSKVKVTRPLYRGVNASGSCSGERENVLAVGTYCYVAVCTLHARSARRREALRRPQREERGGGIFWRPPAYLPPAHHSHPPSHFHCSIPGSKLTCSTNLFHHSLLAPTWTAFSDYTGPDFCAQRFSFLVIFFFFILGRAVD